MAEGEQEMLVPRHRRYRVLTAILVFAAGLTAVHWLSPL